MKKILLTLFFAVLFVTVFALEISAVDSDGNIVVVLDPGHGGYDPGSIMSDNRVERDMTLEVALACKAELEAHGGFTVYLTRYDNDTFLDRYSRAKIADSYNADLLLSIHFDSMAEPYTYIRGSSCYASVIDRYNAEALGNIVMRNLESDLGIPARHVFRQEDYGANTYYWSPDYNWAIKWASWLPQKADWYGILLWNSTFAVPSLIVEHAFLSNADDKAILMSDGAMEKIGKADARSIIEYYSHEHTYSAQIEKDYPTSCCYPGKSSYRCSICACRKDTVNLSDNADPSAHIYLQSASSQPTCTEDGYIDYICAVTELLTSTGKDQFGYHTYRQILPAKGHSYESSSDSNGNPCSICSLCGDVLYSDPPMSEPSTDEQPPQSSDAADSSDEPPASSDISSDSQSEINSDSAQGDISSDNDESHSQSAPAQFKPDGKFTVILILIAVAVVTCSAIAIVLITKPQKHKKQ